VLNTHDMLADLCATIDLPLNFRSQNQYICGYCVICSAAKCIAVNVEYRLAPEHKFPIFLDDSCMVARWVLDNKIAVGQVLVPTFCIMFASCLC
jgi:alpha/beta hydrolase fold